MAPRADELEAGLRELAGMIAEAYRRRITGDDGEPRSDSGRDDGNVVGESEILTCIESSGSRPGHVYAETVRVEHLIRRNHEGRWA